MTRGRPKLTDEQKKSRNMTFRTRGGLRERLAAAAEMNGRSISEEIETRLLRSFDESDLAQWRMEWAA